MQVNDFDLRVELFFAMGFGKTVHFSFSRRPVRAIDTEVTIYHTGIN